MIWKSVSDLGPSRFIAILLGGVLKKTNRMVQWTKSHEPVCETEYIMHPDCYHAAHIILSLKCEAKL